MTGDEIRTGPIWMGDSVLMGRAEIRAKTLAGKVADGAGAFASRSDPLHPFALSLSKGFS
jgi:hypothetical protein